MNSLQRIGFGGGCHWCTEAVFQSLHGVINVQQGWIASDGENNTFSEAVIIDYDARLIPLDVLIEIHLHTHKSTSAHSMRKKYRSAIYVFRKEDEEITKDILESYQSKFNNKLITQVLPYSEFKPSREAITNYYFKNPQKPFCKTFINPKLKLLLKKFSTYTNNKIAHLNTEKA
ncbi:peptide methionine sulfoxide reductase [Algibacter marinivivus]|uniref:peptide-methionine (S)-S-oxide reductase n=1 Tax=Algibacter marinivivus TaxID=2100723 RepID=A0A2U2X4B6_9FLAO|nr:peptide-methionine (S)-S-oxide reductase [Algibacter marinivivus]PWH82612.1 peptide methionine sulfoxide reductase [Algibacter marinivivus]